VKRVIVLCLGIVLIGIPVAIAKTSSSSEPQRGPAAKPAVQKPAAQQAPSVKQRAKRGGHDGPCKRERAEAEV
jgi:hypothetical protein